MGTPPLAEIIDYIMTIGIRSADATRAAVFDNFHVLFKDKTEQLVQYLFDDLAPKILHMATNISKGLSPDHEDGGFNDYQDP